MKDNLKKIVSVHRLPWTGGAITSAVVHKDGAVYVAGVATENTGRLGGRQESTKVGEADSKAMAEDDIDVRIGMRGTLVKSEPAAGKRK
ncbi:MAG: hypothetical protein ABR915_04755 [Thermoguttaceae bacterium]|jgi:hypothetical protein